MDRESRRQFEQYRHEEAGPVENALLDDLSDAEPLAGLEHQHDPLPVRIAERNEHPRRLAPGAGDCAGITRAHAVAAAIRGETISDQEAQDAT